MRRGEKGLYTESLSAEIKRRPANGCQEERKSLNRVE